MEAIEVDRDTLKEWAEVHPEFSAAVKRAKTIQEDIWGVNAMRGFYNTPFAIFFGKNNLDYKDKAETDITMKKDGAAALANAILGKEDQAV